MLAVMATPFVAPRRTSRAAVTFILITMVLDAISLGIILPVFPKLVEQFVAGDTADAARIFGLFGTGWALMQFIFQPIVGMASDSFGRRPIILLSNVGMGLDYILMALAPNLAVLFAGRLISGLCASSFATATAYVSDITPQNQRAAAFGKIGAAFGFGFVLGPAIGGLLGASDPRLPFWVAACFSLVNAAYGYFVLPESLLRERQASFEWRRANPLGALRLLRTHVTLIGLATVLFLEHLAHMVLPSIFVFYAGYRYGWDARAVGFALAAVGLFAAIVQGWLVPPMIHRFGERRTLLVGLLCGAAGFAFYGWAPNQTAFILAIPVMALWGVASPPAQGIMTRLADPKEQGQLQGANSCLTAIGSLIAPGLFTQTFAYFITGAETARIPGAPFYFSALLLALATVLAWWSTRTIENA
jgi:MFS transporter, DHA1 family, tetracycline resistance protein